jgi:hypothetical protein
MAFLSVKQTLSNFERGKNVRTLLIEIVPSFHHQCGVGVETGCGNV